MKPYITAVQITDANTPEYILTGHITKVYIRNNPTSLNDLLIGINEAANTKCTLPPSDSLTFNARPDTFYDGNVLRFKFENPDPGNNAVLIIEQTS